MMSAILGTFGLNEEQATCLYSYGKQQIMYNTYQAYGNLVTKTVNESISPLMQVSYDLTARVATYYNEFSGTDCNSYFTIAIPDDTAKVDSICANYDFNTVEDVSYFLTWPWYGYTDFGLDFKDDIMEQTGMNDAEFTTFYDVNKPNSFGYFLRTDLEDIQEEFDCPSS
jgi:hypothetical protein